MALQKIVVMVQSWKLLCPHPHDKLQLLNSKVGRAKEVGVYASQDFWLDKVSRPEDSFMYENTGDWTPKDMDLLLHLKRQSSQGSGAI